jgi:hypothetical protein
MTPRVTPLGCIPTEAGGHDAAMDRQENEEFPGEQDGSVSGDWNPQRIPRED